MEISGSLLTHTARHGGHGPSLVVLDPGVLGHPLGGCLQGGVHRLEGQHQGEGTAGRVRRDKLDGAVREQSCRVAAHGLKGVAMAIVEVQVAPAGVGEVVFAAPEVPVIRRETARQWVVASILEP